MACIKVCPIWRKYNENQEDRWNFAARPVVTNQPALLAAVATTRPQSAVRESLPNEGPDEIKGNEAT